MRWCLAKFALLACAASVLAAPSRQKRDLFQIKNYITSTIFGSSSRHSDPAVRLFRIPGINNFVVRAVPKEAKPQQPVKSDEAAQPIDDPVAAVVSSYLGTKSLNQTVSALLNMKKLLSSGILSAKSSLLNSLREPVSYRRVLVKKVAKPVYMLPAFEPMPPLEPLPQPQPLPTIVEQFVPVRPHYSYTQIKKDGEVTYLTDDNQNVLVRETKLEPPPQFIRDEQGVLWESQYGTAMPLPPPPMEENVRRVSSSISTVLLPPADFPVEGQDSAYSYQQLYNDGNGATWNLGSEADKLFSDSSVAYQYLGPDAAGKISKSDSHSKYSYKQLYKDGIVMNFVGSGMVQSGAPLPPYDVVPVPPRPLLPNDSVYSYKQLYKDGSMVHYMGSYQPPQVNVESYQVGESQSAPLPFMLPLPVNAPLPVSVPLPKPMPLPTFLKDRIMKIGLSTIHPPLTPLPPRFMPFPPEAVMPAYPPPLPLPYYPPVPPAPVYSVPVMVRAPVTQVYPHVYEAKHTDRRNHTQNQPGFPVYSYKNVYGDGRVEHYVGSNVVTDRGAQSVKLNGSRPILYAPQYGYKVINRDGVMTSYFGQGTATNVENQKVNRQQVPVSIEPPKMPTYPYQQVYTNDNVVHGHTTEGTAQGDNKAAPMYVSPVQSHFRYKQVSHSSPDNLNVVTVGDSTTSANQEIFMEYAQGENNVIPDKETEIPKDFLYIPPEGVEFVAQGAKPMVVQKDTYWPQTDYNYKQESNDQVQESTSEPSTMDTKTIIRQEAPTVTPDTLEDTIQQIFKNNHRNENIEPQFQSLTEDASGYFSYQQINHGTGNNFTVINLDEPRMNDNKGIETQNVDNDDVNKASTFSASESPKTGQIHAEDANNIYIPVIKPLLAKKGMGYPNSHFSYKQITKDGVYLHEVDGDDATNAPVASEVPITTLNFNPIVVPEDSVYSFKQDAADGSTITIRGNKETVTVKVDEVPNRRGDIPDSML